MDNAFARGPMAIISWLATLTLTIILSAAVLLALFRVRINDMVFVDYLSYHKVDDRWLITSKAYHREV